MEKNYQNIVSSELRKHRIFRIISNLADKLNVRVFLVGGFVRDILIEKASKDADILVIGNGPEFAASFAKEMKASERLNVFKNFGTANVKIGQFEIEFVGARKESYSPDSRNPEVESGTFEDDMNRRDFTINTIALSLNKDDFGQLIDPFNGISDLESAIIKTPGDPDATFSDDPLRMMRAIRFACRLQFRIEEETFNAIKRNTSRISIISAERISEELNKIILADKPSLGFIMLDECGLLEIIFPELLALKGTESVDNRSHKDNFYHTLQVLDNVAAVSGNLWLRWATLLHDIGKPATKQFDPQVGWTFHAHDYVGSKMVNAIFRRMRLPMNEKMHYVKKLVLLHLRPVALTKEDVTDSAVRRLIVDAGDDIHDLLILSKADVTSKNMEKVRTFLHRFHQVEKKIALVEEKDRLRNWKNPITGEMIMDYFDVGPSQIIGKIKDAVKEAIMDGMIKNDTDQAIELMLKLGEQMHLPRKKHEKNAE